ncbi:MAG: carboxypeptidase-like regulatory domain-containing protein [Bacteroidota bacterium]
MNSNSLTSWLPRAESSGLRLKKSSILLVVLSFTVTLITAQTKLLQGRVTADSGDITGVTIQNMTSKRATITDFNGNFSIRASTGDTLVFSAVQFKRKIVPVTEALFATAFVVVPLEAFVNELKEVVVQPFGLSGDLDQDLNGLQMPKDVSAVALGLPNAGKAHPTQSERLLAEANGGTWSLGAGAVGAGTGIPVNPLINAITGRTKRLKNRVKVDRTYARTQGMRKEVTDSIFEIEFQIPKTKIADFMYFCEVDQEFQRLLDQGDGLKLWSYLLDKSKVYRENNGLE